MIRPYRALALLFLLSAISAAVAATSRPRQIVVHIVGVTDPGPRGGAPGAGGPLPGLNSNELAFFTAAQARFDEIDSVSGTLPGETGSGLGPRFNLNQCSGCHAQPASGGTSPAVNPEIAVATLHGATNTIPSFITSNGPAREARFIMSGSTYDGEVHGLFVITHRSDAPSGCTMTQPNFAAELAANNVVFRIPTPLFGLGLVENVTDANLIASQNTALNSSLGINSGYFNRNGNTGTISRFGWKAQNPSLEIFSGEAYNVEQGVTNDLFPTKRMIDQPVCAPNGLPEDTTNLSPTLGPSPASDYASDTLNFAAFARFLAAPVPVASYGSVSPSSITNGKAVFTSIGCIACHVEHQTTTLSAFTGQSNVTFSPFSDFALHGMGVGLADGIVQGQANGDAFRTAPLWGAGQRLFFLHDGRTTDIVQAVTAHASSGSEATQVMLNFNGLSESDQQDLINFLRSL